MTQPPAPRDPELQRLVDQAAVAAVVKGIGAAEDRRDWAACRAYFADTVTVDYTSLDGGSPVTGSADAAVGQWQRGLGGLKATLHVVDPTAITVDGDEATAVSNGVTVHVYPNAIGGDAWKVWGVYTHRLRRAGAGEPWKVDYIQFALTYAEGNRDVVPRSQQAPYRP